MQTELTISIDTTLTQDVLAAFDGVMKKLPTRKGASFRRLQRRIQRVADGERAIHEPEVRSLGGGRLYVLPPREIMDFVDEAVRLGVI